MTQRAAELAEWRRLAGEATPGEWHTGTSDATAHAVWAETVTNEPDEDGIEGHLVAWCHSDWRDVADAAFIAYSHPARVLALLDEVERLREAARLVFASCPACRDVHGIGCSDPVHLAARAALSRE